jgi:molybdopterin-guanine dinucleotide biosynthesis protein
MIDDTSLEFDMFEDMRRKLVELLITEGYERLEAEKVALYVVQGVREVPKLLSALAKVRPDARAEVLEELDAVLENAWALEKAKATMLEHESKQ